MQPSSNPTFPGHSRYHPYQTNPAAVSGQRRQASLAPINDAIDALLTHQNPATESQVVNYAIRELQQSRLHAQDGARFLARIFELSVRPGEDLTLRDELTTAVVDAMRHDQPNGQINLDVLRPYLPQELRENSGFMFFLQAAGCQIPSMSDAGDLRTPAGRDGDLADWGHDSDSGESVIQSHSSPKYNMNDQNLFAISISPNGVTQIDDLKGNLDLSSIPEPHRRHMKTLKDLQSAKGVELKEFSSLQSLEINARYKGYSNVEEMVEFLKGLPNSVDSLSVDLSFADIIEEENQASIIRNLPKAVTKLGIGFRSADGDPAGEEDQRHLASGTNLALTTLETTTLKKLQALSVDMSQINDELRHCGLNYLQNLSDDIELSINFGTKAVDHRTIDLIPKTTVSLEISNPSIFESRAVNLPKWRQLTVDLSEASFNKVKLECSNIRRVPDDVNVCIDASRIELVDRDKCALDGMSLSKNITEIKVNEIYKTNPPDAFYNWLFSAILTDTKVTYC